LCRRLRLSLRGRWLLRCDGYRQRRAEKDASQNQANSPE
jgi:hypothetical protein